MKKLLVIILVIALLVVSLIGCSNRGDAIGEKPELNFETTATPKSSESTKSDEKDSETKKNEDKPDVEIEDSSETMRILLPKSKWEIFSEEDVDLWEQYIKDKYDFNIDLVIVSISDDGWSSIDISSIKANSDKGGYVYIANFPQLNSLIESELIEPVNQYISQIDRYNTLDDEILKGFADSNDSVWSLPLSNRTYHSSLTRYYSKAWLEKAGIGIPKTIEEFYGYSMFVANNNTDDNIENNVYVASYTDYSWLYDFGDILRAFGCYSFGQSPVAYNPQKEMYENCIFNENFIDAISYIKLLKDEGVIYNRRPTEIGGGQELALNADQIASTTRMSSDYTFDGGISIGNYLSGINTEYIVENRIGGNGFAVLSGTKEVPERLNEFFNMLLSDPNSFMDFSYGAENIHYTEESDYFSVESKDVNNSSMYKRVSIFIGLSDMGFSEKYIVYDGIDRQLEYLNLNAQLEEARSENDEIDDAVTYTVPLSGYDSRIDIIRGKIYIATSDFCRSVLSLDVPIEEAIKSYQNKLKLLNVFNIIDEMNMELN